MSLLFDVAFETYKNRILEVLEFEFGIRPFEGTTYHFETQTSTSSTQDKSCVGNYPGKLQDI